MTNKDLVKGLRLTDDIWRILAQMKLDLNLSTMEDVIKYLLNHQEKKEKQKWKTHNYIY